MLKFDELSSPNSCFNKAADDELVFVLREKDALFAATVRAWAEMAKINETHSADKIAEAASMAAIAEGRRNRRYNRS